MTVNYSRIGVVGAGAMGRGIAQIAAQAGSDVLLLDSFAGAAERGREALSAQWNKLHEKNKIDAAMRDAYIARVKAVDSIQALAGCDLIVEAIVEDLEVKRKLFSELEGVVAETATLVTNTSSLSVTAIAAGLKHPARVAGFHFFNPVPLMKVVEVVAGFKTAPEVCKQLAGYATQMGHSAVQAQDTPGFIVNHAGRGFGTEGLRILAEGVAEFHDVDRVLRDVAGFVVGPFELMDITALDVSHPVMESIYRQYYDEPRYRPQPLTRQMLAAGLVGRKAGRGFYRYDGGQKQAIAEAPAPDARPASVWLAPDAPATLRALLATLGVPLDDGAAPRASSLCVVAPVGDDATTCVQRLGLDARRSVAVETLFDLSRRRVVMTTPATAAAWRDAAHGLFAADGVPVTVIRDSAGLVAQRVVATIVNIACDIAQQRIATPADIDLAVKLGLNYPLPPLAWGDRLGARTVLAILERMHAFSGDPRYRPSPWLKRRALLGLSLLADEGQPDGGA